MKQLRLLLLILIYSLPTLAQKQQKVYGDAVLKFVNTNNKYYMVSSTGDTVLIIDPVTGKLITRSKSGSGGLQIDQEGNVTNILTQTSYGNGNSRNAVLLQRQSRGTINNPNAATVAGDLIGAWQTQGNTGSAFLNSNYLFIQAAEDWKDTGKHAGANVRWQIYGTSNNGAGGNDTSLKDREQYSSVTNTWAFIPIGASYNYNGGIGIGRPGNLISGRLDIGIGLPTETGETIRAAASQTANLWQLLNSAGTVLAYADANGNIHAPNLIDITKYISSETPSGSINGTNTTFTLANTPVSGTVIVFLNGLRQKSGAGNDYTISGSTITYLSAPLSGDVLTVSYISQ